MSELIQQYDGVFEDEETEERFTVRAYGEKNADGDWEAWLVFLPEGGGESVRTGRETEQHSREDLEYWASGITDAYLEGALERARSYQGE